MVRNQPLINFLGKGIIDCIKEGQLVAFSLLAFTWLLLFPLSWLFYHYLYQNLTPLFPLSLWSPLETGIFHDLLIPWQQSSLFSFFEIIAFIPLVIFMLFWPPLQAGLLAWSKLLPLNGRADNHGWVLFFQGISQRWRTFYLLSPLAFLLAWVWLQTYKAAELAIYNLPLPETLHTFLLVFNGFLFLLLALWLSSIVDIFFHLHFYSKKSALYQTLLQGIRYAFALIFLRLGVLLIFGFLSILLLLLLYNWHLKGFAGLAGAFLLQQLLVLCCIWERMVNLQALRHFITSMPLAR